jgi:ABC-type branched-subunit amino acid transport system ATPase component
VILSVHFFPSGLLPSRKDFAGWLPSRRQRKHVETAAAPELGPVEPMTLSMSGLTKSYGALTAVDTLDLEVRPGTLTALVGPNGAGKTTLLDLIAAEQPATGGRITLDGEDVTHVGRIDRARRGIARTYQRLRLVPSLNVIDNVLLGVDRAAREEGGVNEDERLARAHAALEEVGLTHRADSPVVGLTFGERRLVEMARAIASRPRLVLLDEPSSGLNDAETEEFANVVRRLHATGCTVLLVEHNLPFVRDLAEDVIALDRGKLLAHGDTESVFSSPDFQRAYVGVEAA